MDLYLRLMKGIINFNFSSYHICSNGAAYSNSEKYYDDNVSFKFKNNDIILVRIDYDT